MGPTASGKTALALDMAQHLDVEIISVDSALVYRGMDIGTNKPSLAELQQVPHHLIDICDPSEAYSAARFACDALSLMQGIQARGRIPLLVGGTMFYFRALTMGLDVLPAADPVLRSEITAIAQHLGWPALHERLAKLDPQAALRMHPHDGQRIQRALEIHMLQYPQGTRDRVQNAGMQISRNADLKTAQDSGVQQPQDACLQSIQHYHILAFAKMVPDRRLLHQLIEARFYSMLAQGLVAEVEALWARGDLRMDMPSMRAVGYRQIVSYLQGIDSYEVMIQKALAATRQLAKRQCTWIRAMPEVMHLENTHLASLKTMLNSVSQSAA